MKIPTLFTFVTILFLGIGQLIPIPTSNIKSSNLLSTDKQLKYYLVDRIRSNLDYAKLSNWGINSAVIAIPVNGSNTSWQNTYNAAHAANIKIIIWPLDISGDNECGWESPFHAPINGNYIGSVTRMLDWWATKPDVLGIVTFHEPMWESSDGCKDSISDLSTVHTQIHTYTNNPNFKVWGYVDNIVDAPQMNGFTSYLDMDSIMDVAVTWQHCAGNAEGACEGGSNSALGKINRDRIALDSVGSQVELVFISQTFTAGSSYRTKFTLSQLQTYSCDFLNTHALDGYGYYTWDEGWYTGNLKSFTDLQPAIPYVFNNCTGLGSIGTQTPTSIVNNTNTPTKTPTGVNTIIPTLTKTRTPTLTRTKTATPTLTRTSTLTSTPTMTISPTIQIIFTSTDIPVNTPECIPVVFGDGVRIVVCK